MSYRLKKKPPHLKQSFVTSIAKLSHDGRGISIISGKTSFIFGALPDEQVEFHYEQTSSRFDEGQIHRVLQNPHSQRVAPKCPHFGICGGCQLQHLQPLEQVQHKQTVLLELLKQQGIQAKKVLPPLVSDPWNYRRKIRLSIHYEPHNSYLGFRERKSHRIAPISACEILDPSIANKIIIFNQLLNKLSAASTLLEFEIAIADNATALIIHHLDPLPAEDQNLLTQFAEESSLVIYSKTPSNGLLSLEIPENSSELKQVHFYYDLPDYKLRLHFNPQQFIQVNADINQKMIAQALNCLAVKQSDSILDLFCGIGNFSLPLGLQAKEVTGVEIDQSAVKQAQDNAHLNQIMNCEFFYANLCSPPWQQRWAKKHYDKILLDPPRTGAAEICQNITQWSPKSILYLSCNPATLARDAKLLAQKGYKLNTVGIIDMFPQTKHVETMALFNKSDH